MRRINTTAVNVIVNDRLDRTNVAVVALGLAFRRLRLFVRGACQAIAKHYGEQLLRSQAMLAASAGSPSWGGHSPSGGPGRAMIS